jgi:hypothetical protein
MALSSTARVSRKKGGRRIAGIIPHDEEHLNASDQGFRQWADHKIMILSPVRTPIAACHGSLRAARTSTATRSAVLTTRLPHSMKCDEYAAGS